jgi:hypothetical protein
MPNIKVCDDWHGTVKENFNFTNHADQVANVSSISGQTWPFVQSSPIQVPAKTNSGPGSTACQIADGLPNKTYSYYVDVCPTGGAPKTVTIP